MKLFSTLLGTVILAGTALAASDSPMAVAKSLAKSYHDVTLAKDLKGLRKISTPDISYVMANGMKNAGPALFEQMKAMFATTTYKRFDVKALSARKVAGGISYVQASHMIATMPMGGPKPSLMDSTMRHEVFVVKKGGAWLIKTVKEVKNDTKIDGKPVKM